jgi:RNA polymerase sigma-70 factor, ECF subfamily
MKLIDQFNEDLHTETFTTPESVAIEANDRERLERTLETLPHRFREVLVLREIEGCSYKEIASTASIPIGTVMSSLSRACRQLRSALTKDVPGQAIDEL